MSDFQVGDKVRIVYEGTVEAVGATGVSVDVDGTTRYASNQQVAVLERRKPKVGDKVGSDDFAGLPKGTVLKYKHGGIVLRTEAGWVTENDIEVGPYSRFADSGYTILHLPD